MRLLFLLEDYCYFYTQGAPSPDFEAESYDDKLQRLLSHFFYYGNSYDHAFSALGHECATVVPHCRVLQQSWARDHGLAGLTEGDFVNTGWREILLAQIERFRPDVVFFFSGVWPDEALLQAARPSVRLFALQWSCRLWPGFPYAAFDVAFSSLPRLVDYFRGQGLVAQQITHSFDARLIEHVVAPDQFHGAVFVGTLWKLSAYRNEVVERLAASIDGFDVYAPDLDIVPASSPIWARYKGTAFGLDMYRAYAEAGVAVHVAGDEVRDFAGARRHFEIAGSGALLMTEAQPGLDRLFEPGKEAVTFENADDCVDKVRYFLSHPAEAKEVARAGQARVLRDHSADALAKRIEPVLLSNPRSGRS